MTTLTLRMRHMVDRVKKERTFFFYSLSSLLLQASVMFSGFFVLRFVSPERLGIWRTVSLVIAYGDVLSLGITRGLGRELPFYLGRKKKEQAKSLAATAQFYTLVSGGLASAAVIAAIAFVPNRSIEWTLALLGMGIYWFMIQYRSYLVVTFRAEAEFRLLTARHFIETVLNMASLILVVIGGFRGMVVRYVLLSAVMTILLYHIRPIRVKPSFSRPDFFMLVSTSIPQYISGYLMTISMAFAQTIVLQRGSVESIGLYAPVAAITPIMMAIRNSVGTYINPRMMFQLGKHDNPQVVTRGVLIILGATAAISLPIIIAGLLATPLLVPTFFPEYAETQTAIQLALIGGGFLAVNGTIAGLYALKAWRLTAVYVGCTAVLRWVIPWLLTENGDVIVGASLGQAIANVLGLVIGLLILWRATQVAAPQKAPLQGTIEESG
ncbi:MAG: oligosaccharide flippase family protein [Anaerolineales bacterium]|nr:oligosaccharide flippase family protein [Anaerolineales bacterium]